jgi:hypothetical protein
MTSAHQEASGALWRIDAEEACDSGGGECCFYALTDDELSVPDVRAAFAAIGGAPKYALYRVNSVRLVDAVLDPTYPDVHDQRGRHLVREWPPIPFGRYSGTPVDQLPLSYLDWLASECEKPVWRSLARRALREVHRVDDESEDDNQVGEPDSESAAVRFPLFAFELEEVLRAEFGADPAAGPVVARAVSLVRRHCEAATGRLFPTEESGPK